MGRINLNHWFVKNNEMSISLLRYFVNIHILSNDEAIFFRLTVIDNERYELVFNFYSLEDAISFTENVIAKSITNKDIFDTYMKYYEQQKFAVIKKKSIKRYTSS